MRKFNALVDELHNLRPEWSDFPIPEKLSEEIAQLRTDPTLLEDVWLSELSVAEADWLLDDGVRKGIRAMHQLDRCAEH